jgi:Tfp pilus assembly protein PilX
MATLFVSLMLLFLITLVTLYAANTLVVEQQISANQYRTDQALAAADAGLEWGIAAYNSGTDCTDAAPCTNVFTGADAPRVEVRYCRSDDVAGYTAVGDTCANAPATGAFGIVSIGYSDDNASVRIVKQRIDIVDGFGAGPKTPMTSLGQVDTTGNFNVWNRYFNVTIWTGDSLNNMASGASTYIRNPDLRVEDLTYEQLTNDASNNPDTVTIDGVTYDTTVQSSYNQGNTIAIQSDIISADPNLTALQANPSKMFRSYFKAGYAEVRAMAQQAGTYYTPTSNPTLQQDITNGDFEGGLAWYVGDIGDITFGRLANPIFLIVEGNITSLGNGDFWGFAYAIKNDAGTTGNIAATGNGTVFGAIIAEGTLDFGGTPNFVYDPTAFVATNMALAQTRELGTWKDW